MFSPQDLHSAVTAALLTAPESAIPAGHKGALLTVIDGQEAKLVVARKIGSNWYVEGEVAHPWDAADKVDGKIVIHGSW